MMVYPPWIYGKVLYVLSRQASIYSAATYAILQESTVSDLYTTLIKVRATLGLCYGWRQRDVRLSIRRSNNTYIHWGIGAWAYVRGGGGVYIAFSSWNLVSTRFSDLVSGRVRGKEWRLLKYPPCHWHGL